MASSESTTHCDVSLLLVGNTGNGKSTLGNNILNLKCDPFKTGDSDTAVTMTYKVEFSRYEDQTIKVVDMPGLSDCNKDEADDIKDMVKQATAAVSETPDGYNAVLVVVQIGRQSREDKKTITSLKEIFGKTFFSEYGILVVTRGDDFKRRQNKTETFYDYCSEQKGLLNTLWKECNRRAVLFDNVTENKAEQNAQRKELFDLVNAMSQNNRYMPDMFKAAKAKRDELIARVLTDRVNSILRLMMHDLNSVELETPSESIAQLEKIKARAQEFVEKIQGQDAQVNKPKAVLAMTESIRKATERKIKLASLMVQVANETASGEVSSQTAKELESTEKLVKKNEENLNRQYGQLQQEGMFTKSEIAIAALAVLTFTLPCLGGAIAAVTIGGIACTMGTLSLPFIVVQSGLSAVAAGAIGVSMYEAFDTDQPQEEDKQPSPQSQTESKKKKCLIL